MLNLIGKKYERICSRREKYIVTVVGMVTDGPYPYTDGVYTMQAEDGYKYFTFIHYLLDRNLYIPIDDDEEEIL